MTAFLEIAGPVCPSERPRPDEDGRIARNPARLHRWIELPPRRPRPRPADGLQGVRLCRSELLAYFDEPTTNGYAEGVINKVKVIKRRSYGLPTFEGLRERDSQHAADATTRHPPLDDENPVFDHP